jgi:hypothetical protein
MLKTEICHRYGARYVQFYDLVGAFCIGLQRLMSEPEQGEVGTIEVMLRIGAIEWFNVWLIVMQMECFHVLCPLFHSFYPWPCLVTGKETMR